MELAWKIADPRTPAELLQAVWRPGDVTKCEHDPKWQESFDALLSIEANFDKAWKVRQKTTFQSILRWFGPEASKPILIEEITDQDGARYVLVVTSQPMEVSPGHGSISYYWFGNDGVLGGAGLMNTGHRCTLVNAAIAQQHGQNAALASELQLSLAFNGRDFFLARFVLGKDGLQLTRLADAHGESAGFNSIGESLLDPDKQ